jgi:drug efflux transport system permease protein
MLPIIFAMPLIQLLILVHAATLDIDNVDFIAADYDNSYASRMLINKIEASSYFTMVDRNFSYDEIVRRLSVNEAKAAIVIQNNFENEIQKTGKSKVQFIVNAEDGMAAGLIQSYLISILADYNLELITSFEFTKAMPIDAAQISVIDRFWFNIELNFKHYMVPGILCLLVTMIGLFLSSMNIVKEKEIGTIEQLNVTPIKKHQFIIGKLVPFWVIGIGELTIGLIVAVLVFDVPIRGNLLLIFSFSSLYLIVVLAGGMLISTVTATQQQAMFISWFFMVIFTLMSGLFTPLKSMPGWAQDMAYFNPVAHFVEFMRRVMLKGAGLPQVSEQTYVLLGFAIVLMTLAVWRYKKAS